MKAKIIILALVACMLLVLVRFSSIPLVSAQSSHAPISITSNGGFSIGSNGVTSGSGTQSNPWIIENWIISASSTYGIRIQNTTAYFTIRNCLIENGGTGYSGIRLDNVVNGTINNNICNTNKYGIYLYNSSNYENIYNNTCNNNREGIRLYTSCDYDNLTSNVCNNNTNYNGIDLDTSCNYNNLTNNTCSNNAGYGISLYSSSNYNVAYNNTCDNNSSGIALDSSSSYDNFINGVCSGNSYRDIYITRGCNYNIFDLFWSTSSNKGTGNVVIKPPNTPTSLSHTSVENSSSVTISAYNDDNYSSSISGITVYFYDNSADNLINSTAISSSGGTASVTWNGLGTATYTFFAQARDNYGGLSYNSGTCSFSGADLVPPNKPINLSPSTRQTTTSVTISAYDNDDFGNSVTVYFYDNSNGNLIGSQSVGTGGTASVIWSGLASGNTYVFYAMGEDNNGSWSNKSATCSFGINTPILINGNVQFTPANGVNGGGTGTVSDPYIIENYVISASAKGIDIRNTTAYFIVRNCLIENGGWPYRGIYLYNVTNGTIDNNTCNNCREGIELDFVIYSIVSNNSCSKNIDCGIQLWISSYDNVTGNICENSYEVARYGGYGIAVENGSNYNIISNNNCSNNSYGILLFPTKSNNSVSYNTIAYNTCNNENNVGIYLLNSSYNTLSNNICNYGNNFGIYLYNNSSNDNLSNNICNNNSYGIYLSRSPYNILTNNSCNNNSIYGIALYNSSNNNNCINGVYSGNTTKDIRIGSGCNYNIFDLFWSTYSNSGTGNVLIKPPNMPTSLSPSIRQTTTSPTISAYDNDNYSTFISGITVYFYDNSSGSLIGSNVISKTGGTASTIWGGLTRGNTYTFFAVGQDNYGAWSRNSNTQIFKLNSLPTVPTSLSLSPSTIYVGTTLTATAGGSTDADGDTIIYYYRFINQTDGVERQAYSTTNSYTIQQADSLDNIVVFTKAYDGYEYSGEKDNTIAVMPTQYYLTVTSPYDTPTPASGWFDNGTIVTETVTSPVPGGSGTQYVCTGWTGTGSVPTSGTGTSVTFTITAPSSIAWNWKTQYYLTVTSPYGTTGGEGWYDNGATANATVTPLIVSGPPGVQYVFTNWSGDATGTTSPSDPIIMDSPKTAIANWETQ